MKTMLLSTWLTAGAEEWVKIIIYDKIHCGLEPKIWWLRENHAFRYILTSSLFYHLKTRSWLGLG